MQEPRKSTRGRAPPHKRIQTKLLLTESEHVVVSAAARAARSSIAAFIKEAVLTRAKSMRQQVVENARKEAADFGRILEAL